MPVERRSVAALPRTRFQNSIFTETAEWKDAIREIEKGLSPQEVLQISLSEETIAKLSLREPVRSFYVTLRRYVKTHQLAVDVLSRVSNEDGRSSIWVVGRPSTTNPNPPCNF